MENLEVVNAVTHLNQAIAEYMRHLMNSGAPLNAGEIERMVSGVKAFMWVNWYKDPYLPLTIGFVESQEDKIIDEQNKTTQEKK